MVSFKPLAGVTALVIAAGATPYSVSFQAGTPSIVDNAAACAVEGGTCKDAGCRNGSESCAILPGGTVCLDHGDAQVD